MGQWRISRILILLRHDSAKWPVLLVLSFYIRLALRWHQLVLSRQAFVTLKRCYAGFLPFKFENHLSGGAITPITMVNVPEATRW